MARLSAYDELLLEIKPQPIRNQADYRRALKQLDALMEPHPPRESALMIDLLASLVQQYESTRSPERRQLSPAEFLAELIEARQVTHADVSKATGVPRSAISNVLAGRRAISKSNATRLAQYFRVPVSAFFEDAP